MTLAELARATGVTVIADRNLNPADMILVPTVPLTDAEKRAINRAGKAAVLRDIKPQDARAYALIATGKVGKVVCGSLALARIAVWAEGQRAL